MSEGPRFYETQETEDYCEHIYTIDEYSPICEKCLKKLFTERDELRAALQRIRDRVSYSDRLFAVNATDIRDMVDAALQREQADESA